MAKIVFNDGKEVTLSTETTRRLRKELLKPSYDDHVVKVSIGSSTNYPIQICGVTRHVADVEAYIKALQEAVDYCKLYNLGV